VPVATGVAEVCRSGGHRHESPSTSKSVRLVPYHAIRLAATGIASADGDRAFDPDDYPAAVTAFAEDETESKVLQRGPREHHSE